jgi:CubicO group peptidase (beta-lactamase class C family)
MTRTCVDSVFTIVPERARGYFFVDVQKGGGPLDRRGLAAGQIYNASLHDTSSKIPGGGLLSTSGDLVRLAIALNGTRLLKPESIEAMWTEGKTTTGKPTQYGLGWRIEELGGEKLVGHSGGQAGTSTYLLATPSRKSAVAVMCNLQGASLRNLTTAILTTVNTADTPVVEKTAADLTGNVRPAAGYGEVASRLSSFITAEIVAKKIPAFSIALVDGNRVVGSEGFGKADAAKNLPATADSLYRVGSVSKLFTDMAVMQLVQEGSVDLDAAVSVALPTLAVKNPFEGRSRCGG